MIRPSNHPLRFESDWKWVFRICTSSLKYLSHSHLSYCRNTMSFKPRCLLNPKVWQLSAGITDHQANAVYTRTLLSRDSSFFHGITDRASLLRNHTPCTVDFTKCSSGVSRPLRITCPDQGNQTYDSDVLTSRMIESSVTTMEYVREHPCTKSTLPWFKLQQPP